MKVKREFPNTIIRQNYVGRDPTPYVWISDHSVNIWSPLWPREWFLKIPKFTPYLEPLLLAPMGTRHWWLKSQLAPSPLHGLWKFQCASFNGSGNIKGCVKHTKMDKNRVTKTFHLQKIKISFHPSRLVRVIISAQNNFGNSSKVDLKFLVPLAVMQTQNSKGRQFFRGRNSKFRPTWFCVLLLSTGMQKL